MKSGLEVVWRCLYCTITPIAESTAIGDEDMDAFDIPVSLKIENRETGMAVFFDLFNKRVSMRSLRLTKKSNINFLFVF